MKVVVVKCEEDGKVEEAINKLLDSLNFEIPSGKKILIKPNFVVPRSSDTGTTTNLKILEALIKKVKKSLTLPNNPIWL